jgi:hypothetical protein
MTATLIAPSSFPLRFAEVVNFRGDFGANELVNPKGVAFHPALNAALVTLTPNLIDHDKGSLVRQWCKAVRTPSPLGRKVVMTEYVLLKQHLTGRLFLTSFVCGEDARRRSFHSDVDQAKHFATPDAALVYRSLMPRQLGGAAEEYRVHQILPDGKLVDIGR